MRAFLSLVIAVVASVAGHLLLWGGGSSLVRLQATGLMDHADRAVLPSVFVALGVVCLAIAMLTAAWSSLGVILIGLVQTLSGLAIIVLPAAIFTSALTSAERIYRPVGDGLFPWWASGLGLVTGLVFFVGGIAIAGRRPRSTAAGRVTTLILSLVLGAGVVVLLALGGARLIQAIEYLRGGIEVLGVLLVLGAAVLTVIVLAGVRFSSLGAIVLGILVGGLGALLVWDAELVLRPIASNRALVAGLDYPGGGGGYLAVGVLVLVAGIAGLIRAARRRAAEPAPEVEEHIGYQAEQPTDELFGFADADGAADAAADERPADRV